MSMLPPIGKGPIPGEGKIEKAQNNLVKAEDKLTSELGSKSLTPTSSTAKKSISAAKEEKTPIPIAMAILKPDGTKSMSERQADLNAEAKNLQETSLNNPLKPFEEESATAVYITKNLVVKTDPIEIIKSPICCRVLELAGLGDIAPASIQGFATLQPKGEKVILESPEGKLVCDREFIENEKLTIKRQTKTTLDCISSEGEKLTLTLMEGTTGVYTELETGEETSEVESEEEHEISEVRSEIDEEEEISDEEEAMILSHPDKSNQKKGPTGTTPTKIDQEDEEDLNLSKPGLSRYQTGEDEGQLNKLNSSFEYSDNLDKEEPSSIRRLSTASENLPSDVEEAQEYQLVWNPKNPTNKFLIPISDDSSELAAVESDEDDQEYFEIDNQRYTIETKKGKVIFKASDVKCLVQEKIQNSFAGKDPSKPLSMTPQFVTKTLLDRLQSPQDRQKVQQELNQLVKEIATTDFNHISKENWNNLLNELQEFGVITDDERASVIDQSPSSAKTSLSLENQLQAKTKALSSLDELLTLHEDIDFKSYSQAFLGVVLLGLQDAKIMNLKESNILFEEKEVDGNRKIFLKLIDMGPGSFPASTDYSTTLDSPKSPQADKLTSRTHSVRNGLMGLSQAIKPLTNLEGEFVKNKIKGIVSQEQAIVNSLNDASIQDQSDLEPQDQIDHECIEARKEIIRRLETFVKKIEAEPSQPWTLKDLMFSVYPEYGQQWKLLEQREEIQPSGYVEMNPNQKHLYTAPLLAQYVGQYPVNQTIDMLSQRKRNV